MFEQSLENQMVTILEGLSKISLTCQSQQDALQKVVEIGHAALESDVFSIALIDCKSQTLRHTCYKCQPSRLQPSSDSGLLSLDCEANDWILKGKIVESHSLQVDQRKFIDMDLDQNTNLNSALLYPLLNGKSLLGYIFHFSIQKKEFDDKVKHLMSFLSRHSVTALINCDRHYKLRQSLKIFSELSKETQDFNQVLLKKACELFDVPIAILWVKNKNTKGFIINATAGEVDEEYQKLKLSFSKLKKISRMASDRSFKLLHMPDIGKKRRLIHQDEVTSRGWVSLLSTPLRVENQLIGALDLFTKNRRFFEDWEQDLFISFANHAALSIQKELLRESTNENLKDRKKLQALTEVMFKMTTQSHKKDDLLNLLLEGVIELLGPVNINICEFDYRQGEFIITNLNKECDQIPQIKIDNSITGKSYHDEKTIVIPDVKSPNFKYKNIYLEVWNNTRSEITIPILLDRVPIRINRDVKPTGTKIFGILNIESEIPRAFSEVDRERLELLARHTASQFEKIEINQKLNKLKPIEKQILNERNFEKIIESTINGITSVLQYKIVNISLVNSGRTHIKTEYVIGLPIDEEEKFKKRAQHSLTEKNSKNVLDIQADLVQTKEIEAPKPGDLRLDEELFKDFKHYNLVRVFLPMIEPARRIVIGTIEAGYDRRYRKFIYEQDVQILKNFVDYALHALEQKKSGFIDRITHEFRSPIIGIRNNVDYLKRRIHELDFDYRNIKFSDILNDCEMLLYQVSELEYILGDRNSIQLKKEVHMSIEM